MNIDFDFDENFDFDMNIDCDFDENFDLDFDFDSDLDIDFGIHLRSGWVLMMDGLRFLTLAGASLLAGCEPPPAAPLTPAPPAASASSIVAPPVVASPPPVDAGGLAPVASAPPPPPTETICDVLDRASAAAPATEPDGVTRTIAIREVKDSWTNTEGGFTDTTLYPSGYYHFRHYDHIVTAPRKDGYYLVTDRGVLQALFDELAGAAALARVFPEPDMRSAYLSMVGSAETTTVSIAKEDIVVRTSLPELPSRAVGTAEPPGLARPAVVGHYLADLKVLHAASTTSLDCVPTFTHAQAVAFATLAGKRKVTPENVTFMKPFLEGAAARLPPSFSDVKGTFATLVAAASKITPTAPASPVAPPPSPPRPAGDVQVGAVVSSPPVSNADRVAASLRARFRACYMRGTPEDQKHGGKLRLRAVLAPSGEVSSASIVENGGAFSAAMESCIKRALTIAQFDAPGGAGATLDLPLVLSPAPTNL